jgi:predicted RND superfamily exporter protein
MFFSKITVVSDIGLLIGRGALLSLGMVLFFLPSIIYITDKWFVRKKIRNKLN